MSPSPCLKARISSPLEAGPGPAFSDQLPGHVEEALRYVSKRLERKAQRLTLLVVRRDYQLPTEPLASPTFTPSPRAIPAASLPLRLCTPAPSRLQTLKQLVRPPLFGEGQVRERIVHTPPIDHRRNGTVSPAFSESSALSASTLSSRSAATDPPFLHRARWPGSPATNGSVPVTPATPFTPFTPFTPLSMSSASGRTALSSPVSRFGPALMPARFGIKLVYAHPLSPREEKTLRQAFDKAAKKYHLDSSYWLPEPVLSSALDLPSEVVLKSVRQNEPLFASDHLNLLALDHLYTFRMALQAYAVSKAPHRREEAVHELRRLFLASGRRALRKSALLAAYRRLDPVDDDALADVCDMYERAYGGLEKESGLENDVDPAPAWPLSNGGPGDASAAATQASPGAARRQVVDALPLPPPPPPPPSSSLPHVQPPPRPQPHPHAEPSVPASHDIGALDKEMMSHLDVEDIVLDDNDDDSDLFAFEMWYRNVEKAHLWQDRKQEKQHEQQQPQPQPQPQPRQPQRDVIPVSMVEMHPLRSNPACVVDPPAAATAPPRPETPAPPPPTSATYRGRPWEKKRLVEPDLDEMRRTTPRLRPAPPGRALGLKLQTRFDKPVVSGPAKKPGAAAAREAPSGRKKWKKEQLYHRHHHHQQQQQQQEEEEQGKEDGGEQEEEEEQLTARPHSAIQIPLASLDGAGGSIDHMLLHARGDPSDSRSDSRSDSKSDGGGNGGGGGLFPSAHHDESGERVVVVVEEPASRFSRLSRQSQQSQSQSQHLLHLSWQSGDEPARIGPLTPNAYDDISPITRGEWGLLMMGKGRTVQIETC
ncbi:hypothetical protein VTJ83DRAFT_1002 [Remersonia thermophila]|uniref:DUF7582 domain-containing protein n=1 Tax=Remersonia thermophila TaxID=72144 RepID=A0ABR4DN42_9PEZI